MKAPAALFCSSLKIICIYSPLPKSVDAPAVPGLDAVFYGAVVVKRGWAIPAKPDRRDKPRDPVATPTQPVHEFLESPSHEMLHMLSQHCGS